MVYLRTDELRIVPRRGSGEAIHRRYACLLCVTQGCNSPERILHSVSVCYPISKNRSAPMRSDEATPLLRSGPQSSPVKAALARLFMLLIVWSQASFAAHQFEHAIDDVGATCAVCLQFERGDDAVPEAGSESPTAVPAAVAYASAPALLYAWPAAPYLSRASP